MIGMEYRAARDHMTGGAMHLVTLPLNDLLEYVETCEKAGQDDEGDVIDGALADDHRHAAMIASALLHVRAVVVAIGQEADT